MNGESGTSRPTDILQIRGLSKQYGLLAALDDVACEVRSGEVVGLIGPNGAGKTTLFDCIAGAQAVSRGELSSGGEPLTPRALRRLLFYMPDGIRPWRAQPVRWVLDFAIGYFGGRADLRDTIVSSLAIGPLLAKRVGTLSKGEAKRVLLGIGLLAPQPLLLIDEPFDGLDLRQSRDVAAVLRAHASRGRTLFLSIHQIGEAARVCDRFVLLAGGRVRGTGSADELVALAATRGQALAPGDLEGAFLALT